MQSDEHSLWSGELKILIHVQKSETSIIAQSLQKGTTRIPKIITNILSVPVIIVLQFQKDVFKLELTGKFSH